jgi:ABC-type lipoprotein export system ATPase subunit
MTTLVELRDIVVAHGTGDVEVRALDAVDFELREGESVALWGPSGSGKTTLLHVLGGLVTPSGGRTLWRGEPLVPIQQVAEGGHRSQRVAYVFQGSKLLPTLTAYENVAFAAWASRTAGNGARPPEALLGLVGLDAKLDALPGELSGGESQRVAIARALAQAPELLLCDEPTGQLDSDTGARVLDLIDALRAELGFTLVTATHDLRVARRYDRLVELADGRVLTREPVLTW